MRFPVLACAAALALAMPALALEPSDIERAATREATRGLKAITKRLAGPSAGGRDNDTPESSRVQRYLIRKMRRLGHGIHGGRSYDDYRQPFIRDGVIGTNLVAVIPGRELPNEVVLVGGHYDHLGTRSDANGDCRSRGVPGGVRCPGATDNAAGTAIVLAIGKAIRSLPEPPRRTVVLVLWDSEEDGLAGSRYWVSNEPLVPLAQTVAYVNFDLQGSNLLPSLSRTSFAVGAETGGSALSASTRCRSATSSASCAATTRTSCSTAACRRCSSATRRAPATTTSATRSRTSTSRSCASRAASASAR
jgi:hypothetical protein